MGCYFPTGTTELLRGCYHGQLPRKLISNTALPKSECPRGPTLLVPGTLYAKPRSVQKICKNLREIFFEKVWRAMTMDEVAQKAFTAHSRESLMVAGKLTTGTNGASPVCGLHQ
jgi:hypothetical protein